MSDRAPRSGGWRRVALVASVTAVVVLALLGGGLWLYTDHSYRTSYQSGYSYEVAINTNETLTDLTLYLPLPTEGATASSLGASVVDQGNAADDPFSYRVAETRHGPMLAVSADRVTVTPRYYEFVEADGVGRRVEIDESEYDPANPNMMRDANAGTLLTVTVDSSRPVSTADPWGSEPTLSPRLNRRSAACEFPAPDWTGCYAYDSRIYAAYGANETARVDVITSVEGWNAWWVFGWNSEAYRDRVTVALHGPQGGWTNATGTVEVDEARRRPPAG